MARTTISIPDDLRAQMDAFGADINWSQVAARAFERAINNQKSEAEEQEMQKAIDRLRASKRAGQHQNFQRGFDVGQWWAQHHAEFNELQRLSEFSEGFDDFFARGDYESGFSPAESFVHIIAGVAEIGSHDSIWNLDEFDPDEVDHFWERCGLEDERHDPEYVRGFAEGAFAFFNKVKDSI